MTTQEAKQKIASINVGDFKLFKFGLITRSIYRASNDSFVITDTSGSWVEAEVNTEELINIFTGKLDLLQLDWK
jgi:hypothetical protein